jgi:hypothetical protein
MGLNATARRRWAGVVVLGAALTMLLAGETVLKNQLKDFGFLIYWLVCFGFTCLAIIIAFLDLRALGLRTRREQRDLLENTLNKIQSDAENKQKKAR